MKATEVMPLLTFCSFKFISQYPKTAFQNSLSFTSNKRCWTNTQNEAHHDWQFVTNDQHIVASIFDGFGKTQIVVDPENSWKINWIENCLQLLPIISVYCQIVLFYGYNGTWFTENTLMAMVSSRSLDVLSLNEMIS